MARNNVTLGLFALCCFLSGAVVALSCSGGGNGGGESMVVPPALAQAAGCTNWRVKVAQLTEAEGTAPDGTALPPGWMPISNHTNYYNAVWMARCDQ